MSSCNVTNEKKHTVHLSLMNCVRRWISGLYEVFILPVVDTVMSLGMREDPA